MKCYALELRSTTRIKVLRLSLNEINVNTNDALIYLFQQTPSTNAMETKASFRHFLKYYSREITVLLSRFDIHNNNNNICATVT
jgi:hypothetical protein